MFVVMVTPECAPVAKVGGLADVIQGLSREIALRGNPVEIILPKYDCMRYDRIWGLQKAYSDLWVPYHDHHIHCDVFFGFVEGLKCFFIDAHSPQNFFNRGLFYGHQDDAERFVFFCRAAMEFLLKANKHPDVIHCHDWQTGLIPVLLYEVYQHCGMTHPRVCYTLHNLGHQGVVGDNLLRQAGLDPGRLMNADRLQDHSHPNAVNLMKGGVVFSNFVTTVSPRYAGEIRMTHLGCGLQHILHVHHQKLGGVLNGIDYNVWNPEIDPHIPCQYTVDRLDAKYHNKEALRARLWLQHAFKPLVAIVSRLDRQKGVELMRHALFHSLANGCQFVLLGSSPEPHISNLFWDLKHQFNDHPDCHLEIGYNEELAHLIYAGADLVVIPSLYEPCGLTQMIAMKYGAVPVARNTGGLGDTVFDADYSDRPHHERNGFVFNDYDWQGVESALQRAIGRWYSYPQQFRELMQNGMQMDFSWNHPGTHYLNIYDYIAE